MILYYSTLVQADVSLLQSFRDQYVSCVHWFSGIPAPMTHSYVWCHLSVCVAWLIHMCDMTHSYVWHDSFIHMETRLIHMCRVYTGFSAFLPPWHIWNQQSHDSNDPIFLNSRTNECFSFAELPLKTVSGLSAFLHLWHIHMCDITCPCEWVMSHIWMRHVTYMNDSLQTHEWVMSHTWTPVHVCGVTHSYVWHDSFICVTWLIHVYGDTTQSYVSWVHWFFGIPAHTTHSYAWHDPFMCLEWVIHICAITHSYVWHDSFICVTRLIHMCDMTHSYVWHDSFICVTWLIHMCGVTRS